MTLEEDLINQIDELDKEIKECRSQTSEFKRKLADAETNLIGAKIKKSRLVEELRLFKAREISVEISEYDLEIQRFREKFPELCKKDEPHES